MEEIVSGFRTGNRAVKPAVSLQRSHVTGQTSAGAKNRRGGEPQWANYEKFGGESWNILMKRGGG